MKNITKLSSLVVATVASVSVRAEGGGANVVKANGIQVIRVGGGGNIGNAERITAAPAAATPQAGQPQADEQRFTVGLGQNNKNAIVVVIPGANQKHAIPEPHKAKLANKPSADNRPIRNQPNEGGNITSPAGGGAAPGNSTNGGGAAGGAVPPPPANGAQPARPLTTDALVSQGPAAANPAPAPAAATAAGTPPVGAPGQVVPGVGTLTPGGACDCSCFCGVGSFPNGPNVNGVPAMGAMPNPAAQGPSTLTTAAIIQQGTPGAGAPPAAAPAGAGAPAGGSLSKPLTTDALVKQPGADAPAKETPRPEQQAGPANANAPNAAAPAAPTKPLTTDALVKQDPAPTPAPAKETPKPEQQAGPANANAPNAATPAAPTKPLTTDALVKQDPAPTPAPAAVQPVQAQPQVAGPNPLVPPGEPAPIDIRTFSLASTLQLGSLATPAPAAPR
ncbi:hypothetical protein HYALB_00002522 [Hymenoscyphus albidus]|uniref:Uncharacterized protein n=1 Tax=Hymenoscyphus albidus TaxID=595503 RepID=A0A9N9LSK6_9HELO|nr:hypothetical protein HYALB_00002522 [Hymenoscyphus albidus]